MPGLSVIPPMSRSVWNVCSPSLRRAIDTYLDPVMSGTGHGNFRARSEREGLGARRTDQFAAEWREADRRNFWETAACAGDGFRRKDGRRNAGHLGNAAKHATARTRAGGLRGILLFTRARRTGWADLSAPVTVRSPEGDLAFLLGTAVLAGGSRCVVWGDAFGGCAGRIATAAMGQRQRGVRDSRAVGDEKPRQRDPGNQTCPLARHGEVQPLYEPGLKTLSYLAHIAFPLSYTYRSLSSTALTFPRNERTSKTS